MSTLLLAYLRLHSCGCVSVGGMCGNGWAQRSMSSDFLGYSIFFDSGFHVNQDSLEFIR